MSAGVTSLKVKLKLDGKSEGKAQAGTDSVTPGKLGKHVQRGSKPRTKKVGKGAAPCKVTVRRCCGIPMRVHTSAAIAMACACKQEAKSCRGMRSSTQSTGGHAVRVGPYLYGYEIVVEARLFIVCAAEGGG